MGNKFVKRIAITLSFLMMATQMSIPAYATTGACSGHDGVNCSAGSDNDKSVICNDGWTGSSVNYTDMEIECGSDYIQPDGISGSGQAEEVPVEEATGTDSADSFFDVIYTIDVDEETEDEVLDLIDSVDADNVVETVEEILDVVEEEVSEESGITDSDAASEEVAEDAIDEIVNEIMEDIENMDYDDAADELEDIEDAIEYEIEGLEDEVNSEPENSEKYKKRIRLLKKLLAKLRAKAIKHHEHLKDLVEKVKNHRGIYFVRWGNLAGGHPDCSELTDDEIVEALENNTIHEDCNVPTADYDLTITVESGELKVRHKVLFEKNDNITEDSGSSIEADSFIAGHWDGFLVEYLPNEDYSSALNTTVSIGDLNETYTGDALFGKKDIGNTHEIEIVHVGKLISGLSSGMRSKLILHKLAITNKISEVREKIYRLHLLLEDESQDSLDDLEELIDEVSEYNFDETSSGEVQTSINTLVGSLTDDITDEELKNLIERLKSKVAGIKAKAKQRKFDSGMIPFRDTDDDEWYTDYVSTVSEKGIISGYKDSAGNLLGEYRPSNNITVAEILKIAMETSGNGESDGTPELSDALNHWAKGYVKKGEELGLDLVEGSVDLNRNATRAEVVRIMLETLGITPDPVNKSSFFDVFKSHEHADYIEYAYDLGIVSGDSGTNNFRPDDPINRAEAAKIADKIISIVLGLD